MLVLSRLRVPPIERDKNAARVSPLQKSDGRAGIFEEQPIAIIAHGTGHVCRAIGRGRVFIADLRAGHLKCGIPGIRNFAISTRGGRPDNGTDNGTLAANEKSRQKFTPHRGRIWRGNHCIWIIGKLLVVICNAGIDRGI